MSTTETSARLTPALLSALAERSDVTVPTPAMMALPEKAVQFGTGAFLRGFVDFFLDAANAQGQFNGRVVVVGSTGSGRDQAFGEQSGLYTLVERGLVDGRPHESVRVVGAVSRALSAQQEWEQVLACARNPQLSLVFSNTTEVGLTFDPGDTADAVPPRSFPGKLTRFLYERARTFAFAPSKGVIVLPCELLEHNGVLLRTLVLQVADAWGYEPGFARWVEQAVTFCDTLVDRIVPGAPRGDDAVRLASQLGYDDALTTTAETFRLFVIQGDDSLRARLGFADADPGVLVVPDIAAYRQRKVSLLNGAHTISVTAALLAGCDTVAEAMGHEKVGAFIRRVLIDEIAPVVDAPDTTAFAGAVLERFANPFVQHALIDITLHGTTKLRVRIVPTLLRSAARYGRVSEGLAFGFAAHLAYLRGEVAERRRAAGLSVPVDEPGARINAAWQQCRDTSAASVRAFVDVVLADRSLWETDLGALPGFAEQVTHHLTLVLEQGVERALDALLTVTTP